MTTRINIVEMYHRECIPDRVHMALPGLIQEKYSIVLKSEYLWQKLNLVRNLD